MESYDNGSKKRPNPLENTMINVSMEPMMRGFVDYTGIELKSDHEKRPLWILPNCHIFFETFSPLYRYAYEFLIAISEPLSRPNLIHEYVITQYSLYAAMVLQLTPISIKTLLEKLAKNKDLPGDVTAFIDKNTQKFGSAKLFLRSNNYFLELFDMSLLNDMPEIHDKLTKVEEKAVQSINNPAFESITSKIESLIQTENLDEELEKMQEEIQDKAPVEQLISQVFLIKDNHLVPNQY